jgi:transposase-like protein
MSGRGGGPRPKGVNFSELVERYGSEEKCRDYLTAIRWPNGVKCPRDGYGATWIATRNVWECNRRSCGYQFTVRVGSVLQDSKLPLWKWFVAVFLMIESKKGISANQVRRMAGVSYKTAWFLTHRIRQAMVEAQGFRRLSGTVEIDATYIGGKPRFPRKGKRGWVRSTKTPVLGAVERGGDIRLRVERTGESSGTYGRLISKHVDPATAHLYTDSGSSFEAMGLSDKDTTHEQVNHSANEWVRGDVHTNTVESVWSLFKRSIVGSYHHMSTKHMDSYLDEFEWRFNNRHNDYLFRDTIKALLGSDVMTYRKLVERPA